MFLKTLQGVRQGAVLDEIVHEVTVADDVLALPYLRPLYDALHDMLDPESVPRLLTAGTIEVAPLAYMRGRTLNDSFVVLDEAQNATAMQIRVAEVGKGTPGHGTPRN